ncbi:hypothetical protein [uncultured Nostoc sp.]|uniref:hypothetical protein n=1 Tax=uncultured Nostoc sp. TaxID=340711 RepID=UPI0035C9D422
MAFDLLNWLVCCGAFGCERSLYIKIIWISVTRCIGLIGFSMAISIHLREIRMPEADV